MPGPASASLALVSSLLLAAAFPDLQLWYLAWVAFVPLLAAIEIEFSSRTAPFLLSWLFGGVFFFLTCWWLTFAPIKYAGFPVVPTYLLLAAASTVVGFFPALFGLVYGYLRRRLGPIAIVLSPFVWTATEFLRFWLTGNNWNALAYSQAFQPSLIQNASLGGIYLTGFTVFTFSAGLVWLVVSARNAKAGHPTRLLIFRSVVTLWAATILLAIIPFLLRGDGETIEVGDLIAVQPNVPMAGLDFDKWRSLRQRQADLAEMALKKRSDPTEPAIVVLPESPMNYQYDSDPEFKAWIDDFAKRNRTAVLFNSAEPDPNREAGFFNSAVMVDKNGKKAAQYNKIHLLPFGEFVPLPEFAQDLIPPMVGRFTAGNEYDLFKVDGQSAGVMICFESHFPSLSAEYARRGAGFLIEMTNDGYLGYTPVLRQHLANAVFRAVETGLPVYRVTNVGITAEIDGYGDISDEQPPYEEAVRTWKIEVPESRKTLYVMAGDWFAVLSCLIAAAALFIGLKRARRGNGSVPETAAGEDLG